MAVTSIHDVYGVKVDSTVLGGIMSQSINLGSTVVAEPNSGSVYPGHVALTAQNPSATFTTNHVASALAVIPFGGTSIAGLTGKYAMYGFAHADGGTRGGSSAHRSYTVNKGILIPQRLSAEHQGNAQFSFGVVIAYDGTNNPVVIGTGVSVPAAATNNERFTIGPLVIDDVTYGGIRSVEIDFGHNATAEGSDSDIWPTFASINSIKPTVTFRGVQAAWFGASTVPMTGVAMAHADSTIYLRKRASGGTFVADETAEHISLTVCGMAVIGTATSGSTNQAGETDVMLTLNYDGTNAPIVIDTTAAIP